MVGQVGRTNLSNHKIYWIHIRVILDY